jgi:hypothetical protein
MLGNLGSTAYQILFRDALTSLAIYTSRNKLTCPACSCKCGSVTCPPLELPSGFFTAVCFIVGVALIGCLLLGFVVGRASGNSGGTSSSGPKGKGGGVWLTNGVGASAARAAAW